jgi:hypothetical protein
MRKFKKILSAILVMTIVFTLSAFTVLADESGNTSGYELKQLKFNKTFEAEEGFILPSETFTFKIEPTTLTNASGQKMSDGDITSYGIPQYTGISLGDNAETSVSFENSAGVQSETKTGAFDFSKVDFKSKMNSINADYALFSYRVYEVSPNAEYETDTIKYSKESYNVNVWVNKEGGIELFLNVKDNESSPLKKPITFTNYYTGSYDELAIEKKVTGDLGEKDKDFEFTLEISSTKADGTTLSTGTEYQGVIERQNNTKENVTVKVGTNIFTLKDSEVLVIQGVPEGMVYKVTEADYTDYKTTINYTSYVKSNSGGTASIDKVSKNVEDGREYNAASDGLNTPIVEGGNTLIFTNNKESTANTGVKIDVIPYIVIFVIAVAGIIYLVTRKKENRF